MFFKFFSPSKKFPCQNQNITIFFLIHRFSQPSQGLVVKDASDWPSKEDISGRCLTASIHQCVVWSCRSGGGKSLAYFIFLPQTNHSNWVLHGVNWRRIRIQKNTQRTFIKFLSHKAITFPSKSYFLQPVFWVVFLFQDFLWEMVI